MTVRDGWMVGVKERNRKAQARQKTTHKYPWPDERQEKRRGREGRKGREREGERICRSARSAMGKEKKICMPNAKRVCI